MKKYFYYDLHCHTNLSPDAPLTAGKLVKMAKKRGLDGVAITNHNKVYKGEEEVDGIQIIPGVEIDVKGGVHLLGYFVKKDIEKKQDFKEAVLQIHSQGGLAIWAHPLRKEGVLEKNKDIYSLIDGLESGNAMDSKFHQKEVESICREENLLSTAGSDAHTEGQVGMAVLKVPFKITRDNFKEALKEGEIIVRKEIDSFREKNEVWKKRLTYLLEKTRIDKSETLKTIFYKLVLQNYLRINNLHLRKIEFNYEDEAI